MIFEKKLKEDSNKASLHLWGSIDGGESFDEAILDPKELSGGVTHLKLNEIARFVQSGLCILLYWEGEDDHTLIAPLEGAGMVDLSKVDGFLDPKTEGWTGRVIVKTFNPTEQTKHFSIKLEFVKQRG